MDRHSYYAPAQQQTYREVSTPFTAVDGYSAAPLGATLPVPSRPAPFVGARMIHEDDAFEETWDWPPNAAVPADLPDEYSVDWSTVRTQIETTAHGRILAVLSAAIVIMLLSGWTVLRFANPGRPLRENAQQVVAAAQNAPAALMPSSVQTAVAHTGGAISPVFAPSVRYWEADIVRWAGEHGLDPNMVATVMQIESCGDPAAVSPSGAQGLFQVMPFHFAAGETMTDPNTNAYRGMKFLAELLVMFDGNAGLSLAGYNGGPGTARKAWDLWPNETQRYYRWGLGIYTEAAANETTSTTLNQWLNAGGASLCKQAADRLGLE